MEKTKQNVYILFATKLKLNKVNRLDIRYEEIHVKKYHTVTDFLVHWMKLVLESQWL